MGKEVRGGNSDRTNRNSVYVRSEINGALEIDDKLNGIFFLSDFLTLNPLSYFAQYFSVHRSTKSV